jgi:hypothetical protein
METPPANSMTANQSVALRGWSELVIQRLPERHVFGVYGLDCHGAARASDR